MKAGIRAAVVTFGFKQPPSQVHSRYPNQRRKLGTERVRGERPVHLSATL